MREPNARVRSRERFEVSLDGRQVASIVVGALVILGVVFVLGLNVGKQIGMRQAEVAVAPGDLDALDRAPAPAPAKEPLTFHERLTKETPAPPPPADTSPPPAAAPTPAPPATSTSTAPPAATATEAPTPAPAARAVESAPEPAADRPWTVQLAAAQDRAEAERTAAKFASLNPRIEAADVPGKGRFYRVRVGAFETKQAAERYLKDVARETGAKGFVTSAR